MATALPLPSPAPLHDDAFHTIDDDDADTASQRSISLDSPPSSRPHSDTYTFHSPDSYDDDDHDPRQSFAKRQSHASTATLSSYDHDDSRSSMYGSSTSATSPAPSIYEPSLGVVVPPPTNPKASSYLPTYPPSNVRDDTMSISSFASTASSNGRKARPESLLVSPPNGKLVLGIALVEFNHLVGPRIEYSKGDIFEDEEIVKILPFLALPDGAHLSTEDYSYFHLVPSGPNPTTIFGISCNQQIASSALLVKGPDVTRSTVQKAVVILASKPVFGPMREKLRVVTTALFNQRDFSDTSILDDFGTALEPSLRAQLTESGLYMGTSLRELVHTFRQRTLVLIKAMMLQKRIMFFGHPVERLCTFQYSLVSLLPGLLQTLDDCGSPPLATRAPTLSRPTSLKTSDHKSMMAFMGLPLDLFGKDSFFQPYLPLQQLDMIKDTPGWLCGCTNSIVTQQKEIDLLVNIETGAFEFRDLKLERSAGLTAADRKWMDYIVSDVNEGWDDSDPTRSPNMQFKGSDDYLRAKFEEYVSAALSTVKYNNFVTKGEGSGVMITGGTGGDSSSIEDFNPLWISEFKKTNAYDVWERTTDPLLFDIIEPRHPCNEKPSVVADIGLRLQEGIQELKLEQQLAPAREAVARTLNAGSTNFFKAVEGVKERWAAQRSNSSSSSVVGEDGASGKSRSSTPVEVSKADLEGSDSTLAAGSAPRGMVPRPFSLNPNAGTTAFSPPPSSSGSGSGSAGANGTSSMLNNASAVVSPLKQNLSAWGVGIGSFISTRAPRFSLPTKSASSEGSTTTSPKSESHSPLSPPYLNLVSSTSPDSVKTFSPPSRKSTGVVEAEPKPE